MAVDFNNFKVDILQTLKELYKNVFFPLNFPLKSQFVGYLDINFFSWSHIH